MLILTLIERLLIYLSKHLLGIAFVERYEDFLTHFYLVDQRLRVGTIREVLAPGRSISGPIARHMGCRKLLIH